MYEKDKFSTDHIRIGVDIQEDLYMTRDGLDEALEEELSKKLEDKSETRRTIMKDSNKMVLYITAVAVCFIVCIGLLQKDKGQTKDITETEQTEQIEQSDNTTEQVTEEDLNSEVPKVNEYYKISLNIKTQDVIQEQECEITPNVKHRWVITSRDGFESENEMWINNTSMYVLVQDEWLKQQRLDTRPSWVSISDLITMLSNKDSIENSEFDESTRTLKGNLQEETFLKICDKLLTQDSFSDTDLCFGDYGIVIQYLKENKGIQSVVLKSSKQVEINFTIVDSNDTTELTIPPQVTETSIDMTSPQSLERIDESGLSDTIAQANGFDEEIPVEVIANKLNEIGIIENDEILYLMQGYTHSPQAELLFGMEDEILLKIDNIDNHLKAIWRMTQLGWVDPPQFQELLDKYNITIQDDEGESTDGTTE